MLGLNDDFSGVVEGGIGTETTQAFRLVERILGECDADLSDIVKVSVYMTDLEGWEEMNRAYMEVFGERTPARIASEPRSISTAWRIAADTVTVVP